MTHLTSKHQNTLKFVFTVVRIFIGWHFLYEGLAKLFSPWSSAGYLLESQWLFSGLFHRIAENQGQERKYDGAHDEVLNPDGCPCRGDG